MSILKQVVHYTDTNSVEATWVDGETVIRCHSYADVQMQMFRDDIATYGGDVAEYEELIAKVEAGIKPVDPEVIADEQLAQAKSEALAYLASTDWYLVRFVDTGEAVPEEVKVKRAECRGVLNQ